MFQRRNLVIVQPPSDKVAKLTLENQRLSHAIRFVGKRVDNSPPKKGYVDHSLYKSGSNFCDNNKSIQRHTQLAADPSKYKSLVQELQVSTFKIKTKRNPQQCWVGDSININDKASLAWNQGYNMMKMLEETQDATFSDLSAAEPISSQPSAPPLPFRKGAIGMNASLLLNQRNAIKGPQLSNPFLKKKQKEMCMENARLHSNIQRMKPAAINFADRDRDFQRQRKYSDQISYFPRKGSVDNRPKRMFSGFGLDAAGHTGLNDETNALRYSAFRSRNGFDASPNATHASGFSSKYASQNSGVFESRRSTYQATGSGSPIHTSQFNVDSQKFNKNAARQTSTSFFSDQQTPQPLSALEKRQTLTIQEQYPLQPPSEQSPGKQHSLAGQRRKPSEVEFDPLNPNKYKPIMLKGSKDSATFYPVFESDNWTCPSSRTRFRVSILLRRITPNTVLTNDNPNGNRKVIYAKIIMMQLGSKETLHKVFTREQANCLFSKFDYRLDELAGHLTIEGNNLIRVKERNIITSQILVNSKHSYSPAGQVFHGNPGQTQAALNAADKIRQILQQDKQLIVEQQSRASPNLKNPARSGRQSPEFGGTTIVQEEPPRSKSVAVRLTPGEKNEMKRFEDKQKIIASLNRRDEQPSPLDYERQSSQNTLDVTKDALTPPQENFPRRIQTSCEQKETPIPIQIQQNQGPIETPESTIVAGKNERGKTDSVMEPNKGMSNLDAPLFVESQVSADEHTSENNMAEVIENHNAIQQMSIRKSEMGHN